MQYILYNSPSEHNILILKQYPFFISCSISTTYTLTLSSFDDIQRRYMLIRQAVHPQFAIYDCDVDRILR